MYTTIEANLENGVLSGAELNKLPPKAHVLITLLDSKIDSRIDSKKGAESKRSMLGILNKYADTSLIAQEKAVWSQATEQKHEAS